MTPPPPPKKNGYEGDKVHHPSGKLQPRSQGLSSYHLQGALGTRLGKLYLRNVTAKQVGNVTKLSRCGLHSLRKLYKFLPAGHSQPCLSPLKANLDECSSPVHTKSEKFQDEALFLRLGSPFTHMTNTKTELFENAF